MRFYNREKELKLVRRLRRVAILGRRRVGKTTLVEQAYGDKCLTLFVSQDKPEKLVCNDWLGEIRKKGIYAPELSTLKDIFEYLCSHHANKYFLIDEIQNLLKVNKSFFSDLQRSLDANKNIKIAVTGSYISVMKKVLEEYKSPIFGRFDLTLKLNELKFDTILQICHDLGYNLEDAVIFYSVFGGLPKYYVLLEQFKLKPKEFVITMFIDEPQPLRKEALVILKEEVGSEFKIYFGILEAIALGHNSFGAIANYLNLEKNQITKYLHELRMTYELVTKVSSLILNKKSQYVISSNFLNFWFYFIWKHNDLFETNNIAAVKIFFDANFNKYVAAHFEQICREFLEKCKPINFTSIGRQYGKFQGEQGKNTYEIDLVALNEQTKDIMFAECKWQDNINADKILAELKEKAQYVEWHNKDRKESFCIIAKSFKKNTKELNKELKKENCICFDLKDMEKVFKDAK